MTDETTVFPPCPKCGEPLPVAKSFEPSQLGTEEGKATPIFQCPNVATRDQPSHLMAELLQLPIFLVAEQTWFPRISGQMLPTLRFD